MLSESTKVRLGSKGLAPLGEAWSLDSWSQPGALYIGFELLNRYRPRAAVLGDQARSIGVGLVQLWALNPSLFVPE